MLPYFHIFGLTLPAYGVMLVLGFLAAAFFGAWRVKRAGLCVEDFTVIAALGSGIGLLGGVLLFAVVTYTPAQAWALLCAGEFRQLFGGIVFYGALLAGLLGGLLGSWLAKADLRDYINPVAPALPLGHAIGRVGCFLTGCCYGRPTESGLGVVFSHPVGGAPVGVKLLPVQLFESAADLVIFALLLLLLKKRRSRYDGLAWYCVLYGLARFVLEFFRYDSIRGAILFLSTSQWLSLVLWLLAGVLFFLGARERKGEAHAI